jgi:hypothetical protein
MNLLWRWRLELLIVAAILAAHHYGTQPIPDPYTTILILAATTILIAVPWTRHHTTRALYNARVRRAWTRAVIDTGAADPPPRHSRRPASRHGPTAHKIRTVLAGDLLTIRIPRGHSISTLEQRVDALAACLQIKELRISPHGDNARHCRALLIRRDPFHAMTTIPWPNQNKETLSLWDPVPIGINENGEPTTITLSTQHAAILFGGEPGAGKSVAISLFAATGALSPDTRLHLIDGKRVELAAWGPCAQQIAHTPKQAADLLRQLRDIMDDRYRELEVLGRRHVTREDGLPLHLLICDELAFFTANENAKDKKVFIDLFRDIVARGRAAGILVIAATQKPSVDVVPSAIRDLFPYKLALRSNTPQASDTILGQGWASAGADASTIPPSQRGVGYLHAEGARPERVKGYCLDDEGVRQIASRATGRHAEAWLADTRDPTERTGLEPPTDPADDSPPKRVRRAPETGAGGEGP